MDFFSADEHYGHANIIKYCQRPFMTMEEQAALSEASREEIKQLPISKETVKRMNEAILDGINQRVGPDDSLYILGDFCFGGEARFWRNKIICKNLFLVIGNHDNRMTVSEKRELFVSADPQKTIDIDGISVMMRHYPMPDFVGNPNKIHLFGHLHSKSFDKNNKFSLDVGVDGHDFKPWSWPEIMQWREIIASGS